MTALFADVVGSTQLTERMDPEDAREVLGGAVRRMVEAVEAFGGTVKDLAGDGVLALFGAPTTHEDDAERGDPRGAPHRRAEPSVCLADEIRVGIETGLVVPVRSAGEAGRYGATGDPLNTGGPSAVARVARTRPGRRRHASAPPVPVRVGRGAAARAEGNDELVRRSRWSASGATHRPHRSPTRMVGRGSSSNARRRRRSRARRRGWASRRVAADPVIGKSRWSEEPASTSRARRPRGSRVLRVGRRVSAVPCRSETRSWTRWSSRKVTGPDAGMAERVRTCSPLISTRRSRTSSVARHGRRRDPPAVAGDPAAPRARRPPQVRPRARPNADPSWSRSKDLHWPTPSHPPCAPAALPESPRHLAPVRPDDRGDRDAADSL